MEGGKIGIFEDNNQWQAALATAITSNGHTVAVTATSMDAARTVIAGLDKGSLDVAVVNGNLHGDRSLGAGDGEEIVQLLRTRLGNLSIIGLSTNPINGVDSQVFKDTGDAVAMVVSIIRDL